MPYSVAYSSCILARASLFYPVRKLPINDEYPIVACHPRTAGHAPVRTEAHVMVMRTSRVECDSAIHSQAISILVRLLAS